MTKKQEIDSVIYTGLIYGLILFFYSIFGKLKTNKENIFYALTGLLIISFSISNAVLKPKSINDEIMYISMITITLISYFILFFIGLKVITPKNIFLSILFLILLISIAFLRAFLKKVKEEEKDEDLIRLISAANYLLFAFPGIIAIMYIFARDRHIKKSIKYFLENRLRSKCLKEPFSHIYKFSRLNIFIIFVIFIYFITFIIAAIKELERNKKK